MKIGEEFVAIVKGEAGMHDYVPVRIRADSAITVELRGKTYAITQDWTFSGIRAGGSCNGRPFTAQIERTGMWSTSLTTAAASTRWCCPRARPTCCA